jgi:hypothetical protein
MVRATSGKSGTKAARAPFRRLYSLYSRSERLIFAGALLVGAPILAACGGDPDDPEFVAWVEQGWGGTGTNNIPPVAFQADPLKRSTLNSYGITSSSNADPLPLCEPNTGSSTWCTLKAEWEAWRSADPTNRNEVLEGIAKCSVASTFQIRLPGSGAAFPGQWAMFSNWRYNRLAGVASRERLSACILSLVNAANISVSLCLIGPGQGFDAPCSDPSFSVREAGFFGDLFREWPTAYVSGPSQAEIASNGRVCANESCCQEGAPDFECNRRLTRAGTILGEAPTFATKRCSGNLVESGTSGNFFCTQFYSVEEQYYYNNVFTSFITAD